MLLVAVEAVAGKKATLACRRTQPRARTHVTANFSHGAHTQNARPGTVGISTASSQHSLPCVIYGYYFSLSSYTLLSDTCILLSPYYDILLHSDVFTYCCWRKAHIMIGILPVTSRLPSRYKINIWRRPSDMSFVMLWRMGIWPAVRRRCMFMRSSWRRSTIRCGCILRHSGG